MSGNVVFAVEDGKRLSVGGPSCLAMPNGKLLVAFEVGGADAKGLAGRKGHESGNRWVQSKVFRGTPEGWSQAATVPVRSPRLFRDGGDVYLLGTLDGALQICRSPDGGVSWSEPTGLSGGDRAGAVVGDVRGVGGKICALVWGGPASGWTVWGAPKGAGLANRKAWTRGGSTGPFEGWAAFGGARGAGVPAGGVAAKWRPSAVLAEAPEGHPWRRAEGGKGEAWAFFSTASGREHWATALRLDAESLSWHAMGDGSAGGDWGWLPFPGGHAPFAAAGALGGGGRLRVAGHPGRANGWPAWGREALEEEGWTSLAVWESADGMAFERKGGALRGEGGGGVARDPALAEAGGKTWVAWRQGGAESRSARDMRQIALAELGG